MPARMLEKEKGMAVYIRMRKADMMVDFSERQGNFGKLRMTTSQFATHYFQLKRNICCPQSQQKETKFYESFELL